MDVNIVTCVVSQNWPGSGPILLESGRNRTSQSLLKMLILNDMLSSSCVRHIGPVASTGSNSELGTRNSESFIWQHFDKTSMIHNKYKYRAFIYKCKIDNSLELTYNMGMKKVCK